MLKKRIKGSVIVVVGYILSPLSWWNDIIINIPIAYAIGFLFGLISKSLFFPSIIICYWATNIIGLIMVHKGTIEILNKEEKKYTKKDIIKDLIFSILYTLIIVILIKLNILKFPFDYFK